MATERYQRIAALAGHGAEVTEGLLDLRLQGARDKIHEERRKRELAFAQQTLSTREQGMIFD